MSSRGERYTSGSNSLAFPKGTWKNLLEIRCMLCDVELTLH